MRRFITCHLLLLGIFLNMVCQAQTGNDIVRLLKQDPVYISPSMETVVDRNSLKNVVSEMKPFNVNFVIVRNVQGGSGQMQLLSKWLFTQVGVDNGVVIVMAQNGVRAFSDRRTPDGITAAFQETKSLYRADNATAFLVAFAKNIEQSPATSQPISTGMKAPVNLWPPIAVLAIIGGVGWVIVRRNRMNHVRQLAAGLKGKESQVVDGIMALDKELQFVKNSEDSLLAQEERQAAAEMLDKCSKRLNSASRPEEVWSVDEHLDRAIERIHRADLYLQRAKGAKVDIPAESIQDKMRDKREFRLNGCFFCSKPDGLNMEPVEITLGNTQKRVYACHDCAERVRRGEEPMIASVDVGNQRRPWYDVQDYDPRYQYGRYDGMDMISMMVISDMMFGGWHHGYHNSGWSNYGNYGGNFGDSYNDSGNDSGNDSNADFGNVDFGGDAGGGNFDMGDIGDIGGDIGGGDF